ncbi:hypothetical protein VTJ04DRAFT_5970 [Mycothermus thermophilus]|uniref:uncharacterized protein n=1 Tax=Humicola insolens TaxID=85995 RepID=UPI0037433E79
MVLPPPLVVVEVVSEDRRHKEEKDIKRNGYVDKGIITTTIQRRGITANKRKDEEEKQPRVKKCKPFRTPQPSLLKTPTEPRHAIPSQISVSSSLFVLSMRGRRLSASRVEPLSLYVVSSMYCLPRQPVLHRMRQKMQM